MTPESWIAMVIGVATIVTSIGIAAYTLHDGQRRRAAEAASELKQEMALVKREIERIGQSVRPDSMTVNDVRSLAGQLGPYLTQEITAGLNGKYLRAIDDAIKASRSTMESKMKEGHDELRNSLRDDLKTIVMSIVAAVEDINPNAAQKLADALRKTNSPDGNLRK